MAFLNSASGASAWRGYEYYTQGHVILCHRVGETEYEGIVTGSNNAKYSVHIDVAHPKKSTCNCPLADGKLILCKHKVALYFKVFPEEAEKYLEEVEKAEREAQEENDRIYELTEQRIAKMKKSELQQALIEVLSDSPEWVFDRFVRDWVLNAQEE